MNFLVPAILEHGKVIQGTFAHVPAGVILHGTESGSTTNTVYQEWLGTCHYVQGGALRWTDDVPPEPYYVAWQATGGEDMIGRHMRADEWGWHAGADSKVFLGYEFAHARTFQPISNASVNAFCWWFVHVARDRWPTLPAVFPCHSERPQGQSIGKVDAFPANSASANGLRARIVARLAAIGVT